MVSFRGSRPLRPHQQRLVAAISTLGKENDKMKTDLRASKKMDLRASLRQSGIKAMRPSTTRAA